MRQAGALRTRLLSQFSPTLLSILIAHGDLEPACDGLQRQRSEISSILIWLTTGSRWIVQGPCWSTLEEVKAGWRSF